MPSSHAATPAGRRSVQHQLSRAVGIIALFAVLSALASVALLAARFVLVERIDAGVAELQALGQAHAGMLDQETGLRAHLVSIDPSFLEPFHRGQQEVADGNARLAQLVGTDGRLTQQLLDMRVAQQDWVTAWAQPVSQATTVPPAEARARTLATGKVLFDAYRVKESVLSDAVSAEVQKAEDASVAVSAAGTVVAFAVGVAIVLSYLRSRRTIRRALVVPVTQILDSVHRITTGDLAPPPPVDGPAELAEIGAGLSGMTAALAQVRSDLVARSEEAASHARRLRLVVEAGRSIASSLNLEFVLEATAAAATAALGGERCVVWLMDAEAKTLVPSYDSAGAHGRVHGLVPVLVGEGTVGKAGRSGRSMGPDPVEDEAGVFAHATPMIVGARVVGVIELLDRRSERLGAGEMEVLDSLASQSATAVEAARLYADAERRSHTDALTRLANRRLLDEELEHEFHRSERFHRPLAFAMVDIDHFKRYNDRLGHQRGDEALKAVAAILAAGVRESDSVYRYGGEEFAVLMPETDGASAAALAERLRSAVAERFRGSAASAEVTISVGVATFPEHAPTPAELIDMADRALYAAKDSGRNRVVIADAAPDPGGDRVLRARRP